jgi:hypothetical protein
MFLVNGEMFHEAVWNQWIGNLANEIPSSIACHKEARDCYKKLVEKPKPAKSVYDEQSFFSIYVHTKPDFLGYKNGSIFDGRIVEERIEVRPHTENARYVK